MMPESPVISPKMLLPKLPLILLLLIALSLTITVAMPQNSQGLPDLLVLDNRSVSSCFLRYDATSGTFIALDSGGMAVPWEIAFGPDQDLCITETADASILHYAGMTGVFLGRIETLDLDGPPVYKPFSTILFDSDHNFLIVGGNGVMCCDRNAASFGKLVTSGSGGLCIPGAIVFMSTNSPGQSPGAIVYPQLVLPYSKYVGEPDETQRGSNASQNPLTAVKRENLTNKEMRHEKTNDENCSFDLCAYDDTLCLAQCPRLRDNHLCA